MHEVLPGIGISERDWAPNEKKIELVKPFAKSIHIDICDGKFAPNETFLDPKPFAKYTKDIFFELHMMVEEPEAYLEAWAKAGFQRFIGHIEKMSDQASFVARAENLGQVGLAVDGKTSLDQIKVSHQDLDTVLIMTINAGFSGQTFIPEHLKKVKELFSLGLFPIEIDGGINNHTIKEGLQAGASRFVTTSFLFGGKNPEDRYQELLAIPSDLASE
jgi:ribulose-phosphate 3-epimerase